jgi:hypothetical protein
LIDPLSNDSAMRETRRLNAFDSRDLRGRCGSEIATQNQAALGECKYCTEALP